MFSEGPVSFRRSSCFSSYLPKFLGIQEGNKKQQQQQNKTKQNKRNNPIIAENLSDYKPEQTGKN